jgi:hypothetical protein
LAPRLLFFAAPGLAGGADAADDADRAVAFSPRAGWSPITDVSGQTLNTGHLAQPTAMAMGQIFMKNFLVVKKDSSSMRAQWPVSQARVASRAGSR